MSKIRSCKWISLVLASTFVLSAVTGCGSGGSSSSGTASTPSSSESPVSSGDSAFDPKSITEGVKLTVCAPENIKIEDYNTNLMTLAIEDALGVDLEFTVLPSADYGNKLNVMVTGGDTLPDIIFKPNQSSVTIWGQEGAIIPLNKYYEDPNMSPNIHQGYERAGVDISLYLTAPDGNIYGLPEYGQSPNSIVWKKGWVYKPWLEKLGKEVPQTLDEFYEVLQLVASTDLNGNGKADEIGMTGTGILTYLGSWFDFLMSSFVYAYDGEFRTLNNGMVGFAYTTEEWKEGLKYLKKFFDEKLIPIETLTQNDEQYKAMLNSEEQTVFAYSYWNGDLMNADLLDRKLDYTYINALEGPNGLKEGMQNPRMPSNAAVISAGCKNPDAAFLVGDYMCSEEMSISQRNGQRGVDWDYWSEAKVDNRDDYEPLFPGVEIYMIAYDDAAFWGSGTVQNRSYLETAPEFNHRITAIGKAINVASTDPIEIKKGQYSRTYAESTLAGLEVARKESDVISYLPLTIEESDSITDIKTSLKTYIQETTASFLTGSKDIDGEWDSYLAELEQIGYKTVLEVYQIAYDRMYK